MGDEDTNKMMDSTPQPRAPDARPLTPDEVAAVDAWWRAANYLAAFRGSSGEFAQQRNSG